MVATALGFDRPAANSLDAVADRDFVLETLAAAAITSVHLSRLAEEIVLWTSPLVGLARLSDKFTTGSSMMPQKRNPDAAELVRAKAGRMIGALAALLIVMKGLPLAYQKDMQEDKEGTIEALGALSLCLAAMAGMIADLRPDEARMKAAAGDGFATATDLADWLTRVLRMPFREAHHITGRIVARAEKTGVSLDKLPLAEMQRVEPRITKDVLQGPLGRPIGPQSHQLWRHGAGQCRSGGQKMAETAWQGSRVRMPCCGRATVQACCDDREAVRLAGIFVLLWCRQIEGI